VPESQIQIKQKYKEVFMVIPEMDENKNSEKKQIILKKQESFKVNAKEQVDAKVEIKLEK